MAATQRADQVVMIDGCFLTCFGRILNNAVDREKITHIDALPLYNKCTDLFDMEDVPEAERGETARQVAEKILPELRASVAFQRATPIRVTSAIALQNQAGQECEGTCADS
jgi:uncharacterized metal-binding protein